MDVVVFLGFFLFCFFFLLFLAFLTFYVSFLLKDNSLKCRGQILFSGKNGKIF